VIVASRSIVKRVHTGAMNLVWRSLPDLATPGEKWDRMESTYRLDSGNNQYNWDVWM